MPIELKKGSEEKLPKINKRFFAGKKPANERAITKTFIEFVGTDNFPEIQIVDTSAHPDPNSKSGAKLRPDLSVRDKQDVIDPNSPTQLDNPLCGGEVKDTLVEMFSDVGPLFELETFTAQQARGQLATYAVEFCARQHRTHLFFLYIYYPCARLIRFDRAGALVSARFNFTHDCTPLIRFFSRFSKMTSVQRGYDPTVQTADELETKLGLERLKEWAPDPKYERPVFKMEVYEDQKQAGGDNGAKKPNPRKFLVWGALADPESPLGRATRGYPALEVTDGLEKAKDAPIMFLKEQWRSKAIERGEMAILRELNKHGIKHVPTIVCGGDLPGQVTQTDVFANEIGRTGGKPIDQRAHVRFVVQEVGRPLECFSSSNEMFQAIHDAFQGHKQAFEVCGILHRDVSGGNILILPKGGGLLNDWDMAVKVEEVERGPRAYERTGTWAFMSIDLLDGARRAHKVSDDLESFFWVVLYYSLLYLPHNKTSQLGLIIPAIFDQYSYYEEAKGGTGKSVAVTEGNYIGGRHSPRLEFDACMPLTKFVASILHKLNHWRSQARLALHAANADIILDENLPNPPSFEEHKHKDMEYIWDTTLRSCWPTNDAAKLQLVKKPQRATGQAPVEGTGGCGSKKRKSIDESDLESNDEDPKPKKVKSITSEALSHGPKERKSSKKMPSVATRRSTRLHMGSTN